MSPNVPEDDGADTRYAVVPDAHPGADDHSPGEPDVVADDDRLRGLQFVAARLRLGGVDRRSKLSPGVSLVTEDMIEGLESHIDDRLAARPLEPVFLVPGSTTTSAQLDVARTVVRRAERHAVAARAGGAVVAEPVLSYLNRLSDLLYVLARDASGPAPEPPSRA